MTRDEKIEEKRRACERANKEYFEASQNAVDDPLPVDWERELSRPRLCEAWDVSGLGREIVEIIVLANDGFFYTRSRSAWLHARLLTDAEIDAFKGGAK